MQLSPDDKLFDAFFTATYARVLLYLVKACGQQQQAEDIAQDVYLKLWEVRHLLPQNEKEREYYLFTVTRNSFLRHTRKIVRQQEGLSELISLQETGQVQFPADTPVLKEQLSIIAEVLTATDAVKKKYFLLNREEGLSYSQIAAQEGVSRKTVERYIGSVLKLLRSRLTHLFWLFILLLYVLVTIR